MKDEIQGLLDQEVDKLKRLSYDQLVSMVRQEETVASVVKDSAGEEYQISIRAWFDDKSTGVVRVSGAIYSVKNRGILGILGIDKSKASQVFLVGPDGEEVVDS